MEELIKKGEKYVMNTYSRFPVSIVKGKGCRVWDKNGKEYLDFVSGLAVCNLGHSPDAVVEAISRQAEKLIHVSNLYHIEPQIELAEILCKNSFADKVFFCNSGAEANEAAIKLARKYDKDNVNPASKSEIITMHNSFHGRTLATVTATAQEKFQKGFEPLVPGFKYVPFGDIKSLESAITKDTAAIMLEPVQGEGGVNIPPDGYLKEVRELCDEKDILLIFDEIQAGFGRTGRLFAYENYDVTPDIMTLAKGLAGGFPIGAMLAKENVAKSFSPGTHASTFGGNPLAASAGIAAFNSLLNDGVLDNCRNVGNYFKGRLEELHKKHPAVKEVRGMGLILALQLEKEGKPYVDAMLEKGFLINCTQGNVLRFLPPLIVTIAEVDILLAALKEIFNEIE